jgi:hypothetical protein
MSKVVTTTVLPDVAGGSVTLGGTGDSVVVTGNDLRANILQDAGGNAVFTSNGSGVMSGMNSGLTTGALNLIQSQTASNSASVSFTSGIDSTYDVYIFKFIDINPATDNAYFQFQVNAAGGSGFNETITSTAFRSINHETSGTTSLNYETGEDQAQGTSYQDISYSTGNDADQCVTGCLHLFSPSSTTYVKHFYCRTSGMTHGDYAIDYYVAGYFNTTSALTQVNFKVDSGNFDGTIKLYGISKS